MKRILAFILCFVMVFSLVAVAEETATTPEATEFSDVPATSQYREAIATLTGLGIILGDAGTNTFRPEAGITRAEFCVIVARLKNMGALNVPAQTNFTDVTTELCDEWKVKAVRIASDLGIVAGMGDGTFKPDDPVTYEQAVKMLVCLLKYEPMAKNMGGWPAGYIAAGSQIGLTKKAVSASTEPAPRQIIAQLAFNALDIPEMNTTSEGIPSGGSTIIDSTLKYKELTGIVTATSEVSLTEENDAVKKGQIQIDNDKIFNVGTSNADKYFGKEINLYYSEEGKELTIQSCKLTKSNKEYVFGPDEIKTLKEREVQIYTDEDKRDFDIYNVEADVKLVYNNYPAPYVETSAGYLDATYKPYSGNLKLIDNNANNTIDVIMITDAKPFVVSAIDITNNLLYNVYDAKDVLDLTEGSSRKVTIKKGSVTVNFSSIAKNNVLLVSKSLNTTGTKYINVEIVSNTKAGVIKSMSTEDQSITLGTETYEVSDICWEKYESKFQMDSSVTVYLDNQKKVVYIVENAAAVPTYTYGYLINAGKEGQGLSAEKIVASIYTQAGLINNYPFAEKVKWNGGESKTAEEIKDLLNVLDREDINQDDGAVINPASQIVKYTLNAKGEINAIYASVSAAEGLTVTNSLLLGVGTQKNKTYKSGTKMLGTSAIDSSTKIFFVPTDRTQTDEYSVGKNTNLADQRPYTYETYDVDGGIAKVAVVFGDTSLEEYDKAAPIVIVTKIQEINGENGAANKLTAYAGGTEKTYETENLSVLEGVKIGDVIKLKVARDGTVTKCLKLYSPADTFLYTYSGGAKRFAATDAIDVRKATATGSLESDFCIMYGTVHQRYDERMFVSLEDVVIEETDEEGKVVKASLDDSNLYPVVFSSSTVFYTFSKSKGELKKVDDSVKAAAILSFEDTLAGASKVYVSSVDGSPKFVIIETE